MHRIAWIGLRDPRLEGCIVHLAALNVWERPPSSSNRFTESIASFHFDCHILSFNRCLTLARAQQLSCNVEGYQPAPQIVHNFPEIHAIFAAPQFTKKVQSGTLFSS